MSLYCPIKIWERRPQRKLGSYYLTDDPLIQLWWIKKIKIHFSRDMAPGLWKSSPKKKKNYFKDLISISSTLNILSVYFNKHKPYHNFYKFTSILNWTLFEQIYVFGLVLRYGTEASNDRTKSHSNKYIIAQIFLKSTERKDHIIDSHVNFVLISKAIHFIC